MLANTELYFLHGWGYDNTLWSKWLPEIKAGVTPYLFDRGYFKTGKQNFSFNISGRFKILIAHSFGLHYISPADFSQIHMLVLIGGFRNFHECSANYQFGKKQIALMQQKLMTEPSKLLTDFYASCGLKRSNVSPLINSQLLYDDLWSLDNNQIDIDLLKPIRQILLLHGTNDQIVSIEHSKILHDKLPNSKLLIHKNGSHSLPSNNRRWCINTIQSQLSKRIFTDPLILSDNKR